MFLHCPLYVFVSFCMSLFIEDVSASFHSFWNKGKENESLRFIDEKNVIKTQTKLIWLQSMRIVFENIFNIIGIDYHETM